MVKRSLLVLVALFAVTLNSWAQGAKELSKDEVVGIATEQLKAKGISIEGVTVVYDDGNKLWEETLGKAVVQDQSPNYGVMKRGFMNNYRTVYFDFKEPVPDIWVFVDKDTGEVLEVFTSK
jgi:hypothetical protein